MEFVQMVAFVGKGLLLVQTDPHEAKMVSLEPQSIPGGHLNIDIFLNNMVI